MTILKLESIRLFAAIKLSEDLERELYALEEMLRSGTLMRPVRWVAPENIHLTVKFLGQVEAARIPDLSAALSNSAQSVSPFTLTVRDLGCFPNFKRPDVIWAGLGGQLTEAAELVRRVEEDFAAIGFTRDTRPFSPHLTIGRVRREARPAERLAIGSYLERIPAQDYGTITADSIHLIKSDLRPSGPVYTTISSIRLYDSIPRPP